MKTRKYQLKNGLKVILVESRKSPVVSAQVWVRTGSADEPPRVAGLSHFIEHLVFKGSRNYGVGEIAKKVEGEGGELNAYTSFDQTVFHVTISSDRAAVALETLSEMMLHPRFDEKEIDNEREVVIEEIKRGMDSPGRRSSQMMFSEAFKKHYYGRPVIGFDDVIRKVPVKEIKKYYAERYSTRNMFLVVTGDFDSKEMLLEVRKYFEGTPATSLKKYARPKETTQAKSRVKVETGPFKEAMVSLAWKVPSATHKDAIALDVLAFVLGQGDSSRLVRRMRVDQPLVQSVGTSSFSPLDPGIFVTSLGLRCENVDTALRVLREEIERIQTELVSPEEMQKALTVFASDQIYSLETVDGLARTAGNFEFYVKDPEYFGTYIKKLFALTPADIQKAARKYLVAKTLTCTALVEKSEAEIRKSLQDFTKAKLPALPKSKKTKSVKWKKLQVALHKGLEIPRTEKEERAGAKLFWRPQRTAPTLSGRLVFGGGLLAEPSAHPGLTELLSRLWGAGTKKLSETEIHSSIDAMSASLSAFGGRNTLGLSFDGLTVFEKPLVEIVEQVLFEGIFSPDALEREKEIIRNQRRLRADNPSAIAQRAFVETMFKDHPYSLDPFGTEESLESVTPALLAEHLKKIANRRNLTFAAVGDYDQKLRDRVHGWVEALPDGQSWLKAKTWSGLSEDKRVFRDMKKEQSHILWAHPGLALDDPRRYALHVLQTILAGQGGRLFLELRDKKSLAYSVSPIRMDGLGLGYFGAYIACSPEKAATALEGIEGEFKRLMEKPPTEDEILSARRQLVGRAAIDLQRNGSVSNAIAFDEVYGLDSEESLNPADRYSRVTAQDLLSLSREIFSKPKVVTLVGPTAPAGF